MNHKEWCLNCMSVMEPRPLFTSFYYSCPKCDSEVHSDEEPKIDLLTAFDYWKCM